MKKSIVTLALFLSASQLFGSEQVNCFVCPYTRGNAFPFTQAVDRSVCHCEDKSSSFMFTRPINEHLNITQFLRHDLIHDKHGVMRAEVEATGIYQRSVEFDRAIRYFLFSCNDYLTVVGDKVVESVESDLDDTDIERQSFTVNVPFRDIRAEWLGLPAEFSGKFTICPRQRQWEFCLSYNQDLGRYFDPASYFSSFVDNLWFNVELPIVGVENNIGLRQFDIINPMPNEAGPNDLIQALGQKDWLWGKIIQGNHSKTTLAELNLKLGSTFLYENHFLLDYYSVLSFPTGNKQNAAFMFSPVAGFNGHWAVGGGVDMQLLLNRDPVNMAALFFLSFESLFFVRSDQLRTLDLLNKPLTRFLLLTPITGPIGFTVPGVNVLTQAVRVHGYNHVDLAMGWRFRRGCVEFEMGYSIWGHPDEVLELHCPFPATYGIAPNLSSLTDEQLIALQNLLPPGVFNVTASDSTIAQVIPNNPVKPYDLDPNGFPAFIPIDEGDLDLKSGAAKAAINHKAHFAVSYTKRAPYIDRGFGAGFFFDFPQRNTALKNAGVWAKAAAAF
ncbi:MAG TPA: hypothetical protein VFF04_05585 [Candidatus Babeliales bacterium]|nr:hypothetical protein [Candidatus Babeliales bacterium]